MNTYSFFYSRCHWIGRFWSCWIFNQPKNVTDTKKNQFLLFLLEIKFVCYWHATTIQVKNILMSFAYGWSRKSQRSMVSKNKLFNIARKLSLGEFRNGISIQPNESLVNDLHCSPIRPRLKFKMAFNWYLQSDRLWMNVTHFKITQSFLISIQKWIQWGLHKRNRWLRFWFWNTFHIY